MQLAALALGLRGLLLRSLDPSRSECPTTSSSSSSPFFAFPVRSSSTRRCAAWYQHTLPQYRACQWPSKPIGSYGHDEYRTWPSEYMSCAIPYRNPHC
eukprot:2096632-Rhodomonas_salina.1